MSSAYSYSLQNDFIASHDINQMQFVNELQQDQNISATLLNLGVDRDTVSLIFDSPLSGPELTELNHIISVHVPISGNCDYIALLSDEKATTVNGGTFESGSWKVRTLNTVHGSNVNLWVTVSGNQFDLSDGNYFITASARSYEVGNNQLRLFDVTNNIPVFYGENSSNKLATLECHLNVPSYGPLFRLEHRCELTQADTGFGVANGFGGPEIYAQVKIQQI